MDLTTLRRVLKARRELSRHDRWTRDELASYQASAVRAVRDWAYERSPFYQRFHRGLDSAPLGELPVLTKALLMEHYDELVTDRRVRLADVQAHLADVRGAERLYGRYFVAATAGTTGRPGIFLWNPDEWATVLASYGRPYAWGGARFSLTGRTRMAVVSSTTAWHQSALVGATVDSRFMPTLRVDSGEPLASICARLDEFRPEVLVGYASMLRLLAEEALGGRLSIAPAQVFSASEVLTDETRRRIQTAWGRSAFNVYAATETAGVAAECDRHDGMHLFEDLVVTEVVDDHGGSVPAGEFGARILVTVLFSRTLPLIRYEMSDSVRLSSRNHGCGKPFSLLDGIQGREQEMLSFSGRAGGVVSVQPVVFHRVLDTVPAAGWQLIQDSTGLMLLLAGAPVDLDSDALVRRLATELAAVGAESPAIRVQHVEAIPRTALGKAPLIRSLVPSPGTKEALGKQP